MKNAVSPLPRIFFIALINLPLVLGLTIWAAQAQTPPPPKKPLRAPTPLAQMLYAPIFSLGDPTDSEIVLNNNSLSALQVTPVLFTRSGEKVTATPLILDPTRAEFLRLSDIVPSSMDRNTKWGGILLEYTGDPMALGAQITLLGDGRRQSIDIPLTEMMDFMSQTLEAVWFAPKNSTSFLILGNSSDTPINVAVMSVDGHEQTVQIPAFATEIVRKRNTFVNEPEEREDHSGSTTDKSQDHVEGVTLKVTGPMASLRAAGYVSSPDGSFTAMIRFYDPALAKQQNLYATNLRLDRGVPLLVLKNTSAKPIIATPQFLSIGSEQNLMLPDVIINPRKSMQLDLTELQQQAQNDPSFAQVSVRILSSGKPGELIGALYNDDKTENRSYEVPLRDFGNISQSTGAYPVRFDDDFSTIVSVTNVGNETTRYTAYLTFPEGTQYSLANSFLQSGRTALFDIQKIRSENQPDANKNVFPANPTAAQLHWSMIGPPTASRLIGRAEVTSARRLVSSSFSCPSCCPDSGPYPSVDPSAFPLLVPLFQPGSTVGYNLNCYNQWSAPFNIGLSWDNSNPAVGSISQPQSGSYSAQALAAGQTTFTGSLYADIWTPVYEECLYSNQQQTAPVDMTGVQAKVSCNSGNSVTRGASVTCTGDAGGPSFTTNSWKFTDSANHTVTGSPSGNSWSGTAVQSGTVSVNVRVNGTDYGAQTTLTVNPRSNFPAFTAVSPQKQAMNFDCGGGKTLNVPQTPFPNSLVGTYCDNQLSSFNSATIGDGGPNSGFTYITSATNSATFNWAISPDADNPSSQFYLAQCGNFSSTTNTGFIGGATLQADTIRHESGSVQSHYNNYVVAQNNSANNLGVGYEAIVDMSTGSTFETFVAKALNSRLTAIQTAIDVEPCGHKEVMYNQNCSFDGPINFSPYAACQ